MKSRGCRVFSGAGAALVVFGLTSPAMAQFYAQKSLVSDLPGSAITDPQLINPWGVAMSPTSPFWIANAGTKTSTIYSVDPVTGAVSKSSLTVTTPASPSGIVFNGTANFVISQGGGSAPATYLFAGLNGTISGWNSNVPPPATSTQAITAATGAPTPVSYTGIATGVRSAGEFLYAANNSAPGRIDIFDSTLKQVTIAGAFVDPNLPAGDAPFNIANIGGRLYVAYSGPTGVVDIFDTDGTFVKRLATGGTLLNPWGLALAPAHFGEFSKALLVGNFNMGNPTVGPGSISAFDATTGAFLGVLKNPSGATISIDGLWALVFGNGGRGGNPNVLYFSAGIQGQAHGLFGSLAACQGPIISQASANPNVLWPPNHQMVPVTIEYTAADNCTAAPVCSLSVTSNEAGGGNGHGSAAWEVVDAHHVMLLAERSGGSSGRTYDIAISCSDSLPTPMSSKATVTVLVPHDRGRSSPAGPHRPFDAAERP